VILSVRQVDVLRYLAARLDGSDRAWRIAREVFNAPRDEVGHVRTQGAVNTLRSLYSRGYVTREGDVWQVTQEGMDALVEFAFSDALDVSKVR
jgi:hypothetical protein